ncbi:hypothetical protein IJ670_05050, partial [bacterium]|nr:hypothetical protein [bacterium]
MTTSITGLSPDKWQTINQSYVNSNNYRNLNNRMNATSSVGATQPTYSNSNYVSESNNICTDGDDDGHVGFFEAAGHVVKGVGKSLLNLVTMPFQSPGNFLKTVAMIGACCIPVVGPIIGAGLAAYGIFQGVSKIGNAIATTQYAQQYGGKGADAMAKDAWEEVGDGLFTTGVSVVGLKGSVGALKGQLGLGAGGMENMSST